MPETLKTAKLYRIAAAVVVLSTSAVAVAWLVGAAVSPPSDLPPWLKSAVSVHEQPRPVGFGDIVDRVKPAVFGIRAKVVDEEAEDDEGSGFLPPLGDAPDQRQAPERAHPTTNQGSGFFVSADGYAITTNHVIEHGTSIAIETDDGKRYPAKLVGSDPVSDLALLKVDGGNSFSYVEIADAPPRIGEWVIAVGNPFGLGGTVTAGIVSARARDISPGSYNDLIQIDAPVNQGNSGGPTFDVTGKVIGVNNIIVSPTGGSVGIGFAIPAATVKTVMAKLKDKGKVTRGWIGVRIQPITPEIAEGLDIKRTQGALVAEPQPHSPAARAGIQAGDVITSLDGEPLKDDHELSKKIGDMAPGTNVELGIIRQGEKKAVAVTLGELSSPRAEVPADDQGSRPEGSTDPSTLGFAVAPVPGSGSAAKGVMVTTVDPDGIAAERGLRKGDVILDVAGDSVNVPSDVERGLSDARNKSRHNAVARVRSGQATRFVAIPVG